MSDDKSLVQRPGQSPGSISEHGNLLDAALANLPQEQRQRLVEKALEKRLELDAAAKGADQRHRASSIDMANTIHQVRALEGSTKSDYTVKADYETASGRTSVEIKKSNSTVIIVVAVVVAIVFLILFAK